MKPKVYVLATILITLSLVLTACQMATGQTTPQVEKVVETVVVTQEVERVVETSGGVVNVLGTWGGDELSAFQEVVFPFTEETGIGMAFEGTRDLAAVLTTRVEAGNPPDLAVLPNPGQMQEFARRDELVAIDSFLDTEQMRNDYAQVWLDLASHEGNLYGLFYKASVKSLVWYVPDNFAANGYEIPQTWDEMIALSDQIVADGGTPWCLGIESAAASGWPATDWVEDIMLRTAGPEVYDQWVNHEIPWTDEPVREAVSLFGQIARTEDYVVGGAAGVNSINFGDSPADLFRDPPGCYMHRQASFITGFFPEEVTAEEYDFFPFPEIDPEYGAPMLGGADLIVMFNDTPEARQLLEYLVTPEAQEIWAERGGFLSPNKRVNLEIYPDDITRRQAELLVETEIFRFDASDLMPAAVGSGAFWSGMVDYVAGDDLDEVLQDIETAASDAYTS